MRNRTTVIIAAALVVLVAGCGGNSVEEAVVERMLEEAGGDIGDVNFDANGDGFEMSVEGEDGETINVSASGDDEDFSMVIEGEDGESMTIGGGEVPEGMKTPVAAGGRVMSTFESSGDFSVSLEYPASMFDELVAQYDGYITGDGVSRYESSSSANDGTVNTVTWVSADGSAQVSVSDCYSTDTGDLDAVCVSIYESGS